MANGAGNVEKERSEAMTEEKSEASDKDEETIVPLPPKRCNPTPLFLRVEVTRDQLPEIRRTFVIPASRKPQDVATLLNRTECPATLWKVTKVGPPVQKWAAMGDSKPLRK